MKEMKIKKVMVVYGGVSPEHEVAVITALQIMNALKEARFELMPVYISKQGNWFLGNEKYLKPEIYRDLSKVERLGKRVLLSPDRDWGLLSKGFFGFSGSADLVSEVIFPVIHGKGG